MLMGVAKVSAKWRRHDIIGGLVGVAKASA
jgi:hypothetical protein